MALEELGRPHRTQPAGDVRRFGRQKAKGGIVQHFHPDPAEPQSQHQTPVWVAGHPRQHLQSAGAHGGEDDALHPRARRHCFHRAHDVGEGAARRVRSLDIQHHPTDLGLVGDVGRRTFMANRPPISLAARSASAAVNVTQVGITGTP